MKRSIKFLVLGLVVMLNMGASCRQETAQATLSTFLNAIAGTVGDAIGESLIGPEMP